MNRMSMFENQSLIRILESWATVENPFNTTEEILQWIGQRNQEVGVDITKTSLSAEGFWYYDRKEGGIVNRNHSFFQIKGLIKKSEKSIIEQPIIVQSEIGYLGIIGKVFDGVLYFLMQAKIEPGNVNKIQISPTIQATKSNFMQAHGGSVPAYLEYFSNKKNYEIVVDQIQSEQSSRFWGKRNRNIIIIVDDPVEVIDTHRWMTLGQIKQLMKYDNLVNMDTRTVISCIPFSLREFSYKELSYARTLFSDETFFDSVFFGDSGNKINRIYQYMNEFKMLDKSSVELVDLFSLKEWKMCNNEFIGENKDFKVIFCDIEIEGREVRKWQQPLLESLGSAIFGLIYRVNGCKREFLVQSVSEVGCFDKIELGPSVQISATERDIDDVVKEVFFNNLAQNKGVVFSGLFSEEGGRFYHEQNRNILMEIESEELQNLPEGYFWADYQTLNILIQFNNCLNIQLRNLLSILEI